MKTAIIQTTFIYGFGYFNGLQIRFKNWYGCYYYYWISLKQDNVVTKWSRTGKGTNKPKNYNYSPILSYAGHKNKRVCYMMLWLLSNMREIKKCLSPIFHWHVVILHTCMADLFWQCKIPRFEKKREALLVIHTPHLCWIKSRFGEKLFYAFLHRVQCYTLTH